MQTELEPFDRSLSANFDALLATQKVGIIQTDVFCTGCGYNLFSQGVVRDPQTKIPICRCPECGKFSPAGVATLADSGWRRVAGGLLIFFRAMILLGLIILALIFMGVLPYVLAEETIHYVTYRLTNYGSLDHWQSQIRFMRIAFGAGILAIGMAAGLIAVVGFYHWRKRFYYLFCLVPLLPLVIIMGIWQMDHPKPPYSLYEPIGMTDSLDQYLQHDYYYTNLQHNRDSYKQQLDRAANRGERVNWEARIVDIEKDLDARRAIAEQFFREFRAMPSPAAHMVAMTALAMVGMVISVVIGRPISRGMLRVLIPARALQNAAVLWFADGKVPPAAPVKDRFSTPNTPA